jgi:hypothetical protein
MPASAFIVADDRGRRRRHLSPRNRAYSGFSLTGKSCAIRLAAPAYVWASIFISRNTRASVGRFPVRLIML